MWIVPALLLAIALYGMSTVHRVTKADRRVQDAWSNLDYHLHRRYDVLPMLVQTIQQYAESENAVYENVGRARSQCLHTSTPSKKGTAETALSREIKALLTVSAVHPKLLADREFVRLRDILTESEAGIRRAMTHYGISVREFNSLIKVFPNYLIADMLGYASEEPFDMECATSWGGNG